MQTSYNFNEQQEQANKKERNLDIKGLNVYHCFLSYLISSHHMLRYIIHLQIPFLCLRDLMMFSIEVKLVRKGKKMFRLIRYSQCFLMQCFMFVAAPKSSNGLNLVNSIFRNCKTPCQYAVHFSDFNISFLGGCRK